MAFELQLPDIGEGLTEAEIVEWLAAPGDTIEVNDPLVEVETDKAVVEIPSPSAGVLLHQGATAGTVLAVGQLLAVIGAVGETWTEAEKEDLPADGPASPPVAAAADVAAKAAGPVRATPLVRRLAEEHAVDLTEVSGTGARGQVTRDDVLQAAEETPASSETQPAERERMSATRRSIAAHLARSWREIPHVTIFAEANAARLLEVWGDAGNAGQRPPLEALLIRAVLPLLSEYREFNAMVDGDDAIFYEDRNIGVAVDTPEGLVVPVVRSAAGLEFADLAAETERLIDAARSRRLTPDDLHNGTFTISNVGAVGGGYGTPIIPFGTSAILSVGRASPQGHGGQDGFPLSLSFDHRLIDGSLGVRFLAGVALAIETAPGAI